jgi:hypothetical protein
LLTASNTGATTPESQICGYWLSAKSGSVSYQSNWGSGVNYAESWVVQSHCSGGSWYYDTSNQGVANNAMAFSSGNITTLSTGKEIVFGTNRTWGSALTGGTQLFGSYTPSEGSYSPIPTDNGNHQYYMIGQPLTSSAFTANTGTAYSNANIVAFNCH